MYVHKHKHKANLRAKGEQPIFEGFLVYKYKI
jgi:hypothetical protein